MVVKRRHRGQANEAWTAPPAETPLCPLCGRPIVPGPSADAHHLVPRSKGGVETFLMHRICHQKIHATFTEDELAREYHDWIRLRAHPEIASFLRWVRTKPAEYYDRSRRTRALRGR